MKKFVLILVCGLLFCLGCDKTNEDRLTLARNAIPFNANNITLLESNKNCTWITFELEGHKYLLVYREGYSSITLVPNETINLR